MLATTITGAPRGDTPPLLIAHGLFGSARNWGVIARRLSDERQVIAVDMRNHGESPWEKTHSYKNMAADLAEVIEAQGGGPMDVLGHSMGGKAAMVLALSRGELVNRLVVADIAPTRYGHSQMQNLEAMRGVDLGRIRSRGEAERALEAAVPEKGVRAFLAQSLDVAKKKWRLNLDVLAEYMVETLDFPEVSGRFDGPTMFLTGAESTYVLPQHRPEIKRLFPSAVFVKIPGAGHWVHADKPREFEATVRVWLNK